MLRVFFLVACVSVFSLSACLGMDDDKENQDNQHLKRKLINEKLVNKKLKKSETPEDSPLQENPVFQSPERKFWDKLKRPLIELGDCPPSPLVRKTYIQHDTGELFSSPLKFNGKTVFPADILFKPDAVVLSKTGVWETNLQRMERGVCPVGHKGIFTGDRTLLSTQDKVEIRHNQRKYRIELQHVTQKDTGLDDDPICEMTHDAHMGEDTRHILKKTQTGKFEIVLSSLKLVEALNYLESHPECIMLANVLHFREGESLIKRKEFAAWRMSYWKNRAEQIKKRRICKPRTRRTLFCAPVVPKKIEIY
ncbi:MAG: hypothetical protein HYX35_04515 [Proteobacteria bacterium]|nr:hypothetical protein [Pseudomonadota bacterium]